MTRGRGISMRWWLALAFAAIAALTALAVAELFNNRAERALRSQARDDGIGQTVSTKAGVVRVDVNVPVKNPWSLAPFRTFPEVAQPVSPFIIRMDKAANVALFDADGGAWRIAAIKSIGDWLRAALADQETAEGSTSQPLAVKVIS